MSRESSLFGAAAAAPGFVVSADIKHLNREGREGCGKTAKKPWGESPRRRLFQIKPLRHGKASLPSGTVVGAAKHISFRRLWSDLLFVVQLNFDYVNLVRFRVQCAGDFHLLSFKSMHQVRAIK